ncbi:AAA family ATPase, partial [Candidatus Peregrinibacteria bacterium]|nr:AAA family ATPase [Candidatus Peregrinibacteria bacterium]
MDLILFGIQGSGKGTQAKIIAEKYNMLIFETGKELRKVSEEQTPIGNKINDLINNGKLVSDDIIMEMLAEFLKNISNDQKIIFDGIPRTLNQKKLFDQTLNKAGRTFLAIELQVE